MTTRNNEFYPDVPVTTKPRISKEFYDEYGERMYRDDLGRIFYADIFDQRWNCAYTFKVQSKRFKGANNNTLVAITHNQI